MHKIYLRIVYVHKLGDISYNKNIFITYICFNEMVTGEVYNTIPRVNA